METIGLKVTSKHRSALLYAIQGLYVFPVGEDKTPRWKWSTEATTDVLKIHKWWEENPYDNVAIATKPSGLVVLDFDVCPEGKQLLGRTFHDGLGAFEYVAEKMGKWKMEPFQLSTYSVYTPSGGVHLYYRAPSNVNIGNRPILGVAGLMDVRAGGGNHGGYVLAPPSTNRAGQPYRAGDNMTINNMPQWLIDLLEDKPKPVKEKNPYAQPPGPHSWEHFADVVANALPGERNRMLHWCAATMAEEGASIDYVLGLLIPPFTMTAAHHTEDEATATIFSAFNTVGVAI